MNERFIVVILFRLATYSKITAKRIDFDSLSTLSLSLKPSECEGARQKNPKTTNPKPSVMKNKQNRKREAAHNKQQK